MTNNEMVSQIDKRKHELDKMRLVARYALAAIGLLMATIATCEPDSGEEVQAERARACEKALKKVESIAALRAGE